MQSLWKKKYRFIIYFICSALFLSVCAGAGAQQKKVSKKKQAEKKATDDELANSATPDKVLFDRGQDDFKHSRYTEGRLALQTLINTYPDSEYLAKAKLGLADSYFKEGGTTNLTQAIAEYKDFKTFFPFLDEAAYAQMQVGMCHYKMMEKADRDTSQAEMAESEFQGMLLEFPQSALAPQAEQRLRDVQEVLADGEFRIGKFYFSKMDNKAAANRLIEVTERYPLYSQSDEALWMMAQIYLRARPTTKDEDLKNLWTAEAGKYLKRLVQDYPLSKRTGEAKSELTAMHVPIPQPDPQALARMKKEQLYAQDHQQSHVNSLLHSPLSMLKTGPDVSTAAHAGAPNLTPPSDALASANDILRPSPGGAGLNIFGGVGGGGGSSNGGSASSSASSTTGTSGGPASGTGGDSGLRAGAQIITPSASDLPPAANPATLNPPAATPSPSAAPSPAAGDPAATTPPPPTNDSTAAAAQAQPAAAQDSNASTGDSSAQAASNGQSNTQSSGSSGQQTTDPSDESSSKKKKGLHKVIPW